MLRFQEGPPAHLAFYRDPRDMSADPQLCVSPQAIFVFNYHCQLVLIRFHFHGSREGEAMLTQVCQFVPEFWGVDCTCHDCTRRDHFANFLN